MPRILFGLPVAIFGGVIFVVNQFGLKVQSIPLFTEVLVCTGWPDWVEPGSCLIGVGARCHSMIVLFNGVNVNDKLQR